MKNILLHLVILLAFSVLFVQSFEGIQPYIVFVIGLFIGFSLLLVDRILHVIFIAPETEFSQIALTAWKKRQYGSLITLFTSARESQERLTTRSAVFMLCYCALAVYVLTSTTSVLGVGVVLGLGLHFCVDFWMYRSDPAAFQRHFLWQIQWQFQPIEITTVAVSFTAFLLFLCLLFVT